MKNNWFWLILIGFFLGALLAGLVKLQVAPVYGKYIALAILAALDSIFGGVRAWLEGQFDERILANGLLLNTIIAVVITYLGDQVGVSLYWAPVIAFGIRIFQNVSIIRRLLTGEQAGK